MSAGIMLEDSEIFRNLKIIGKTSLNQRSLCLEFHSSKGKSTNTQLPRLMSPRGRRGFRQHDEQ